MASPLEDEKLQQILSDIHDRLSAPALNGGFDKLMYKVDKIEETQNKILEKVSTIDQTIYDPDRGLYARIKNVESAGDEEVAALDRSVLEIKATQEAERRVVEDVAQKVQVVHDIKIQVDDLQRWKSSVTSGTKWVFLTLAGAAVSLFAKFIYDYVAGHIKFI